MLEGVPITPEDFRGETLTDLVQQEFNITPLPANELQNRLNTIIHSGTLLKLGQELYTNVRESLLLRDPQEVYVAKSLTDAREQIQQILNGTKERLAYIIGGLEAGWHHVATTDAIESMSGASRIIMGLETDDYMITKGRNAILTLEERVSVWSRLLPKGSIIFTIPPKPETLPSDDYYNWIPHVLGIYKNDRVVYVGSRDDPQEIREGRRSRAATPKHVLEFASGDPPSHTHNLLK